MVKRIIFSIFCILFSASIFAQQQSEPKDSLVRLISATRAKNIEVNGELVRRIEGQVRFLHNDTYLLCDTTIWYVDREYMDAIGNVQIIQDNTILKGDKLHYIINQDLAQFRGSLVELKDKEGNILRTNNLDYNTKDSIGTFFNGAAMMDKDSNFIESQRGVFESKKNLFTFIDQVEMFSDTTFFISDTIKYFSSIDKAFFSTNTRGWNKLNYLSSQSGWYDKKNEKSFFEDNVYIKTEGEELWCDSLLYDKNLQKADINGNIQLHSTKDNVFILGDALVYKNNPKFAEVWKDPVIVSVTEDNESSAQDTLFMSADVFRIYQKCRCDIDSIEIVLAKERKEQVMTDPIANFRNQNKKRDQQENNMQAAVDSTQVGPADSTQLGQVDTTVLAQMDSTVFEPIDSTITETIDSLAVESVVKDTTLVDYFFAYNNVKAYKDDMQFACDSLVYFGQDSIARLYNRPIIWNEINTQLTSDSMLVVVENKSLSKGNLLSNAFIAIEEDSTAYHQIKSPEMMGYFSDNKLQRFDAIGGFSANFFIAEDSLITTMNQKDGKMMSALFKNEEIQKSYYFGELKSDAFPLFEIKSEDKFLKGFEWREKERPINRYYISNRKIISSKRDVSTKNIFPEFTVTNSYFNDCLKQIINESLETIE